MSSNRKIFGSISPRNDNLFRETERPNCKIEVVLQLEKIDDSILRKLAKDLGHDGMTIDNEDKGRKIITVTGIPPETAYNENSILAVVKKQDKNAKVLSHTIKHPK